MNEYNNCGHYPLMIFPLQVRLQILSMQSGPMDPVTNGIYPTKDKEIEECQAKYTF